MTPDEFDNAHEDMWRRDFVDTGEADRDEREAGGYFDEDAYPYEQEREDER